MKDISEYKKYQVITIPEVNAVNCLYLNNTLIHASSDEYPNSFKIFSSRIDFARIEAKNREFSKVDRYLTCRSLLFTKRKLYSILNSGYLSNIANLITQFQSEDNPESSKENNKNDNLENNV
jgi:hypothetical protein